jgi:transcription termination factor NusB
MKTLRTKQASQMLQDIFKLDISKQEKADKVKVFVHTYGMEVFEDVCNKYFNKTFPDWFEDFVVKEWETTYKPEPDWRNKENIIWTQK